jgi:hypothetical protein
MPPGQRRFRPQRYSELTAAFGATFAKLFSPSFTKKRHQSRFFFGKSATYGLVSCSARSIGRRIQVRSDPCLPTRMTSRIFHPSSRDTGEGKLGR